MANRRIANRIAAAFLGGLGLVATATAAQRPDAVVTAPPRDEIRSERVAFADLNLASAAGRESLQRRVASAVRRVCNDVPGVVPLVEQAERSECRETAWAGARPQIASAIERAQTFAGRAGGGITVAVRR